MEEQNLFNIGFDIRTNLSMYMSVKMQSIFRPSWGRSYQMLDTMSAFLADAKIKESREFVGIILVDSWLEKP